MRKTLLPISIAILLISSIAVGQSRAPGLGGQGKAASSSEVDVVGCLSNESGKLKLTDEDGNMYYLIGRVAGLMGHIGDELDVTGIQEHPPTAPTEHSIPETILRVTEVEIVLHMSPFGVPPVLGDVATWDSYTNHNYGVSFRYPKTFEHSEEQAARVESNFVDQDKTVAVSFESLGIPRETYPNSNFVGGSFTAFVDSSIRSEGTCRQFSSFWPEHTSSRAIHGVKYIQTLFAGAAAGTGSTTYYFHTYQNGLCYEFDFDFDGANGTGMMLMCSTQWVVDRNEFELMDAVLSQIGFLAPEFKASVGGKPRQKLLPTVVSFAHSPVIEDRSSNVEVSWATDDADYVQLHAQCVKNLIVADLGSGAGITCGAVIDRNFPANGSVSLMLGNFNPTPVQFVITVVPFSKGVGYPSESKTMTIPIEPHPPIH